MTSNSLYWIAALPLIGFLINATITLAYSHSAEKRPSVPLVSLIACLGPILAFGLTLKNFLAIKALGGENGLVQAEPLFTWFATPLLSVSFAFVMDHLSAVMTLVVTGVGSLIHIYSIGYMNEDKSFSRYFSYLNLFLFFMLLLVLGENALVLFVGWEGVGLCSYLLIGFWFEDIEKAKAGKKAFIVNRIGDFGFIIGLLMIISTFIQGGLEPGQAFLSFAFIKTHAALLAPFAVVITLCLFVGATGKSAQIPLYVWLPDAMAGPTPVSALIHAATMVTAGIYMVARLFFLFEMAPFTLHIIASIGLATALMAALMALAQTDIKKVLAYSTVSQLGFMFLALGVGAPQTAIFHVMTHAFFKACLFLCSGSVIYAMHHEQDIRNMGGLFKKMPVTGIAFLVSTLAIAGIPPFSGFFSKDEILWNTFQHAPRYFYFIAVFVAGLTSFYMFRLFTYVFLGKTRHGHPHDVGFVMNFPVAILAVLGAVGGLIGIPEVLGGANHIHHWLGFLSTSVEEGGHKSHSLEISLMIFSTVWAIGISSLSCYLYSRNLEWTKGLKSKFSGVYKTFSNKFYVDEIYEAIFVRPIQLISEKVLWKTADQKLVDGVLVHGWAYVAQGSARVISWFQSGVVGHYLMYLWIGLTAILFFLIRHAGA